MLGVGVGWEVRGSQNNGYMETSGGGNPWLSEACIYRGKVGDTGG